MAHGDGWDLAFGDHLTPELTVMRRLGGGSSYEAWLAFDEITWSPVVAKVLRPHLVDDARSLAALEREALALATVNHPVVVRGLRHTVEGPRPHLVMEQADGPRLSTLLRRHGPLQEQQYLPLALDLASVLHYLRHVGWVHLDVKPSNVIMGAPARLIDLSVARPVAEAAALRTPIGTDAYMAPEQCDPERLGGPTPASDVWALGATLHEAVTGERAFSGTADQPHPQLVRRAPALGRRVPAEVREVVASTLDPDPAARPSPSEVSETLQPVLERQPAARLTYKVR
ncbi:serine/threonine protein kinase [Nocardioides sp. Y6]|uniref:non-specific serine/threonine protein kinase n=1 Tax=Nocardioides malaquae TaxID=2773426 RepID=A0ABR9RUM8_9ACTN|nr:serine/threonine-protein kinase [Nocardioides malaquae]MBE7325269.1 serine/threonine protein kinase [Nocardioides malaquae]